jgi:hypothetical protein
MTEENLVSLTMFEEGRNSINPSEEHILCIPHYEKMKKMYIGYNISKRKSSIPKVWCQVCTPEEY